MRPRPLELSKQLPIIRELSELDAPVEGAKDVLYTVEVCKDNPGRHKSLVLPVKYSFVFVPRNRSSKKLICLYVRNKSHMLPAAQFPLDQLACCIIRYERRRPRSPKRALTSPFPWSEHFQAMSETICQSSGNRQPTSEAKVVTSCPTLQLTSSVFFFTE